MPTVPAAKQALLEQLQAHDDLDGVLILIGLPAEVPAEEERIYLTGTRDWARELEDNAVHKETYDLPLLVEVHQTGTAAEREQIEQRLWAIVAAIDDALEQDDELGGAILGTAALVTGDEETNPTDDGWIARASIRVRVLARG